jgi:acetylornithine/succinyldiaminopimelate/putrescine aminotransferase
MLPLRVASGRNDLLFTTDGEAFIDLISSTGAVFLGHANKQVNNHIVEQLQRISCSWTSIMDVQDSCKDAVGLHLSGNLSLYSLYSSGMEATEVAVRIAFHETRRSGIIGFRNNHHGKSVAVQNITGADRDVPGIDSFRRLPFVPAVSEDRILCELEAALEHGEIAAVFVEPMLGRGGGHAATADFYRELQQLCRGSGTLVVCDEIFTGFYRTGPCFLHPTLGIEPDIVLIGKAVSNGFPAAGVLLRSGLHYHPKDFRLSSTFSDNPLACAAVLGTLAEMKRIGVGARVGRIERSLSTHGVCPSTQLRLRGAACFIELETERAAASVHDYLFDHKVLALRRGATVGLWPPATITEEHLDRVVSLTSDALVTAVEGGTR